MEKKTHAHRIGNRILALVLACAVALSASPPSSPAAADSEKLPPAVAEQTASDGQGQEAEPPARIDETVTIGTVQYRCYANGEATLINGSKVSGHFTVPTKIIGKNGAEYTVTGIGSYTSSGRTIGAFAGNRNLKSISFESDSKLRSIDPYAFNACYGLGGSTITLPATVTDIGSSAFDVGTGTLGSGPIARLQHPHVVTASGGLPDIKTGEQIPLPSDMVYDDLVDSSIDNVTLYKSARWTDADLTEAEIRIDFGKAPNYSGKVDFVFVMDHSPSMYAAATYHDSGDAIHRYPRFMLTNDIVYDISKKLLDSAEEGYDNRVALTAFDEKTLWSLPFTACSGDIQEALFTHPLTSDDRTSYSAGLRGAINLINQRTDPSRKVAIVFLSDGVPNAGSGISEASTLRDTMKVKVYPVSMFADARSALQAISHDESTAYNAASTDDLESIITEVVRDIIEEPQPLALKLDDVLSEDFELLTNTQSDVTVSPGGGTVSIQGKNLTWDLNGCAPNKLHTIKIKVKIKNEHALVLNGSLPTNDSLTVSDGSATTTRQPHLERYLVEHEFVNGTDPLEPLPGEVLALLPGKTGGHRDGAAVSPTDVSQTQVKAADGALWKFHDWDRGSDAIAKGNVLFTGEWRRAGAEVLFAKVNADDLPLPGTVFTVYRWDGTSPPDDADAYVTASTIRAGAWAEEANAITTAADPVAYVFESPGIYQLVETHTQPGYRAPDAQWRFTIGADHTVHETRTILRDADALPAEEFAAVTGQNGDRVWTLVNHREATFSFHKVSGVLFGTDEEAKEPLAGAEFELYLWTGAGQPADDKLVSPEAVLAGDWKLAGTDISKHDGTVSFTVPAEQGWVYQLVETTAPANHSLPSGQWRIGFAADGTVDTDAIAPVAGDLGALPPKLQVANQGPFDGSLVLVNVPIYEFPKAGGYGIQMYRLFGGTLVLIALLGTSGLLARTRRNRPA